MVGHLLGFCSLPLLFFLAESLKMNSASFVSLPTFKQATNNNEADEDEDNEEATRSLVVVAKSILAAETTITTQDYPRMRLLAS